jgi:NADH-quinone oxidoreductase subunit J
VQVLVYAGAVMVLFLFIIMLLDLRTERPRNLNIGAWTGGGLVVFGLIGLLGKVLSSELGFDLEKPPVSTQISDVTAIGLMLFRYFNLPFQIVGVLLLVATVGVVVLSKRELK